MNRITFDAFVAYGRTVDPNHVHNPGSMPWSFTYDGLPVTHEKDDDYIVVAKDSKGEHYSLRFHPGDVLLSKDGVAAIIPEGKSAAHLGDAHAYAFYKDGMAEWQDRRGHKHCSYCGSCHPQELVTAMANGASIHWADWKYGWPHKAYIDGAPGLIKFYTKHLMDCDGELRDQVEKILGLSFLFDGGKVWWQAYTPGGMTKAMVQARMQAQGQQRGEQP